jgi:hypothetical protein
MNNFALVIGAAKCGTTSLFMYLSEHPQISACSMKEPNFFGWDSNWGKGLSWYTNLWPWDPKMHKIALEASTFYTLQNPNLSHEIVKRISSIQADFKFIYIMRNPIERIESHYTHAFSENWELANKPLNQKIDNRLIENTKYASRLANYYKIFASEDILLLNFEDLRLKPLKVLVQICSFLEIDTNYQFQNTETIYNPSRGKVRNHPMWNSLRRINALESLGKYIPSQYKKSLRNRIGKKIEQRFRLTPKQQDFILNELRDDYRKLSLEYGFDVSCWGFKV